MDSQSTPEISPQLMSRLKRIKVLLMDVDGVLTDGRLFYFPDASGKPVEFKGFNSQDGVGFHMLNAAGIKSGVISGRESPATVERARILNISYVYQGFLEKDASYDEILQKAGVTADEVAYIGDDFTDVSLMRRSALGCCVGNARPELKTVADIVTVADGGKGAVREIIEIILKAQGKWEAALEKYGLVARQKLDA